SSASFIISGAAHRIAIAADQTCQLDLSAGGKPGQPPVTVLDMAGHGKKRVVTRAALMRPGGGKPHRLETRCRHLLENPRLADIPCRDGEEAGVIARRLEGRLRHDKRTRRIFLALDIEEGKPRYHARALLARRRKRGPPV